MVRTFGLIALIATMTFGCTPVEFAPETEERIRNIGFKENVILSANLILPAECLESPTPIKCRTRRWRLARYMRHHDIDLGAILLAEFKKQVVNHPKFRQKSFGPSSTHKDAIFELEVEGIGLDPAPRMPWEAKGYVLRFNVRARLVTPAGEKLWEAFDYPTGFNTQLPVHTAKEFKDPKLMEDALRKAAAAVVAMLMERL